MSLKIDIDVDRVDKNDSRGPVGLLMVFSLSSGSNPLPPLKPCHPKSFSAPFSHPTFPHRSCPIPTRCYGRFWEVFDNQKKNNFPGTSGKPAEIPNG